mmetsp:Transcript_1561/g.1640  ORF Transcript_1561/g.1640 Transcript_1561/m.1640 type:complete len:146 (-) Transcript_1561:347-784(-)|eukprot:CAMPEP_0182425254 /NCGR_PEP_ID=MMETSP1167-20130531/11614_1 /TAXON_ID=2988 /ORGANISM="Mallomonas Sp, Strain CCMP3275" /LENGTH=145 /DNA_ID=CAMNT_0024605765 /DNA_START=81 /DNA_END=518 /DNA_ORIENTATION=-
MRIAIFLTAVIASVSAFNAPARAQSSSALGMFNFGKKSAASPKSSSPAPAKSSGSAYEINKGTANKGSYIPAGLTKAQYEKVLAEEAKKSAATKKKFKIGKEPETLTEWILECEKKGLKGKDMLLKGHRMVKAKYDEFYTDESPV